MNNTIKKAPVMLSFIAMSISATTAFANSNLSPEEQEAMMKQIRTSEKYSCTPEQLADYIERSSASLYMASNLPDAQQHINNETVKSQENGEESCISAFGNMDVIKEFNELMEKIAAIDPSATMPSADAVMAILKKLSEEMFAAAKEGVCGALTQEAAKKLVNDIMSQELGYDLDDLEKFDAEEFAKEEAMDRADDYLDDNDVDNRVIRRDEWEDMFKDHGEDAYEDMKDNMFD